MKAAARGSLISTVLHHATLLEPDAKEGSSTLTLITTDTSRVLNLMDDIHELWIIPIEIGVAAWLLARQVGAGAIGPGITFIGKFGSTLHRVFTLFNTTASGWHICSCIRDVYGNGTEEVVGIGEASCQRHYHRASIHERDKIARLGRFLAFQNYCFDG